MTFYLLSKEDFAALYKFGTVRIKSGASAESEDPREAVQKIFSDSDSFEYAQERLIISSEKSSLDSISMVDVKDIYPLDGVSKNLFESQFSTALVFQDPVFQDIAEDFLKKTVLRRTTISGIDALRSIFKLEPEKDEKLIEAIIKGKSFLRKYKYFEVPLEERTPYSMLIAYNRYQHYPKDNRGFFYDAADCFMYAHMFRSLQDPEEFLGYDRDAVARYCSKFHGLLDSISSNTRFRDVDTIIGASDQRIKDAIAQTYGSIRSVALFFYAKEHILADETLSFNGINRMLIIQREYPEDFSRLVTLLGGFLGYTWIYDRLYEFQNCSFLSIHHSLDEFQLNEPDVQKERVHDHASEPHSDTSGQPDEAQEQPATQTDVPSDKETAAQGQADMSCGFNQEGGLEPAKDQAISGQDNNPEENGDKRDRIPNPPQNVQDENIILDISSIAKAVFKKSCPRKEAFMVALNNRRDEVISLIKSHDENALKELYLKLDTPNKTDKAIEDKQSSFVSACFSSNVLPLNE